MSRFWGFYIKSEPIATTLDLIRLLVERDSLRRAHITFAGPYDNLSEVSDRTRSFSSRRVILKSPIHMKFGENHIAALRVSATKINASLFKRGIDNPIPHLTLFESDEPEYFSHFFRIVSKCNANWSVDLSNLVKISGKTHIEETLYPLFMLDKVFYEATQMPFIPKRISQYGLEERMHIVELLWNYANLLSGTSERESRSSNNI